MKLDGQILASTQSRRTFVSGAFCAATACLLRGETLAGGSSRRYDVVVYGGSCAGVIAAVQASRSGKSVAIVNPYGFLGGMTSAGLNAADIVEPAVVSGLTREFFTRMAKIYGPNQFQDGTPAMQIAFEAHVAEAVFGYLAREANVPVFGNERLDLAHGVTLDGRRIVEIKTESGQRFAGKVFIDATYEGDLMAKAGVRYVVGRESNRQYGETVNGFQRAESRILKPSDDDTEEIFIKNVSPYVHPGRPASGLLPRISRIDLKNGDADRRVQSYNYRLTLTDKAASRIAFEKPEGYRELDHELLLRNFEAGDERLPGRLVPIPNGKFDWNSFGAVGTDMAGANTGYAETGHAARKEMDRRHETYTRGHLWTLAYHPRVPESVRSQMRRLGYARDEFQQNGGFPPMLYLREGRRMVSDCVMTEQHCRLQQVVPDPVALWSYPMDSHVVQYLVNEHGFAEREGVFLKNIPAPYGISYRSIVPGKNECPNLFVPVCMSASHVAWGSIRMEPTFMALGQAAAIAASLAIEKSQPVQEVSYPALSERLLQNQLVIEWRG